ncbi:MAG: cyclophilin-like fold protein [Candidatus Rokuibacteriota bacterium]
MSRAVRITAGAVSVQATLDDSRTAGAIWDALPIEARVETWGEEIYFGIGVDLADESPRPVVERGDLAYWSPGQAFCVFFGRTPASHGDECRPASPVSVFGRVDGDATVLKKVRAGTRVRVERL